ncbi:MAG: PspA/IM30 family protein [Gammaproteobacteria bacterium]|nr:PspA/IM30 family protein [Gammaproteobacteria bacterium]
MSENLTTRVGRIISGGVNAIVDAMENAAPDLIMEQVVREIDTAIDDVRTELGRVTAGRYLADTRLKDERQHHESLTLQIETAIAEDREDLAEAGISRQLDIEAQIPVLESAIAEAGTKEKELEGYIQALQAKKRELGTELKRFAESRNNQENQTGSTHSGSGNDIAARVARAESAFNRVMEKQSGLATSGAGSEINQSARLAELEELTRNNRVKERLATLKSGSGDS